MTKKDSIRKYLEGKAITDIRSEYEAFKKKKDHKDISYGLFYMVCKEDPTRAAVLLKTKSTVRETPIIKTIDKIKFSNDIFVPVKSGCTMDKLFSEEGGVMPAAMIMVPGESGIGKTTVLLSYLGKMKALDPKKRILFISSEMNEIHLFKYAKRVSFKSIDIVCLGDYETPHTIVEDILKQGWDIVLLDSLQDTVNKCKNSSGLTERKAESWLLGLLDTSRKGGNDLGLYTSFLCTMHMTKGGEYAGSTTIKHMTDAMLMLRRQPSLEEGIEEETYMEFDKNRDGATGRKLYFRLGKQGLTLDVARYEVEENMKKHMAQGSFFGKVTPGAKIEKKDGDLSVAADNA